MKQSELRQIIKEEISKVLNGITINNNFNTELIDRINDEYMENYKTLTPSEINDGYCDIWAELFVEKFGGKHYWSFEFPTGGCGHSWVKLNNKFYDAEVPNGVSSIEELPFVQRAVKEFGKDWLDDKFYKNILN